ncbi:MAG: hypothetical protein U0Z75_09930 [Deinococcaceae bacterium]
MKKLLNYATIGILSLFLASCTPPEAPKTLYQGDWSWEVVNVNNVNDVISGVVSFSSQAAYDTGPLKGKIIAGGQFDYDGSATQPAGIAIMGPVTGNLDIGFLSGSSSTKTVVLSASDIDGVLSTPASSQGHLTFLGTGIYSAGNTSISVAVTLIQLNETPRYKLPTTLAPSSSDLWGLTTLSRVQKEVSDATIHAALEFLQK